MVSNFAFRTGLTRLLPAAGGPGPALQIKRADPALGKVLEEVKVTGTPFPIQRP